MADDSNVSKKVPDDIVPGKVLGKEKSKPKKVATPSTSKNDDSATVLSLLKDIQQNQRNYDSKVDNLMSRIKTLEDFSNENAYYDYDESFDYSGDPSYEEGEIECEEDSNLKRKNADSNSRFASLSKRFKGKDLVDKPIDSTLAENINDLFRKGMDEEQHSQLIKDEINPRPENCEALVTVKCNRIIWDLCAQNVKYMDKKLQNAETSLIKGSTLMTKAVNRLAEVETEAKGKGIDISMVVDQCNDALSLLGHCNRQLCMTRRDLIKPELKAEYSHLCNSSVPFTSELFGDDVSKTAKELEDSARMGHKIQHTSVRGFGRGRPPFQRGRFIRARGMRPRGAFTSGYSQSQYPESKNLNRRGGSRGNYRQ